MTYLLTYLLTYIYALSIGAKINDLGCLNGRYTLYCRKYASFGALHKNLNEDRFILSAEKYRYIDSSFWQQKVCADIGGGSLGMGVK